MIWYKRIGSLCVGFLCSCAVLSLLILRCVGVPQTPAEPHIKMEFPYALKDLPLVLHGIYGYEGPYVEDGTDREVCDVAALVVENVGATMLTDTRIAIYTPNRCFMFLAQCLPAGAKTIVLEKNEGLYYGEQVTGCWAHTDSVKKASEESVMIRQLDMGAIEIVNETSGQIRQLVILHKNWSKEAGSYLGGVVYKTYVYNLQPNQLVLVKPGHYEKTISKIIAAVCS